MFEVLVYLYETYYCPDAFPEPADLAKTLMDLGFKQGEITEAMVWLSDLAETTEYFTNRQSEHGGLQRAQRIYAAQELSALGSRAIGFIQSLESAGILDPALREIVIERALASDESPMPLDKLRLIVLVILWSQGEDPDPTLLNPVFADEEDRKEYLLH